MSRLPLGGKSSPTRAPQPAGGDCVHSGLSLQEVAAMRLLRNGLALLVVLTLVAGVTAREAKKGKKGKKAGHAVHGVVTEIKKLDSGEDAVQFRQKQGNSTSAKA